MMNMLFRKLLLLLIFGFCFSNEQPDKTDYKSENKSEHTTDNSNSIQKKFEKFGELLIEMESKFNIDLADIEEEYEELEGK